MTNSNLSLGPNDHFALFRKSNEKDYHLFIDDDKAERAIFKTDKKGFVFHPFHTDEKNQPLFVSATQHYVNPQITIRLASGQLAPSTKREEYLALCNSFIQRLDESLHKLVLSRIYCVNNLQEDITSAFLQMCKQYPNALVYIFNHPDSGTWIGATPEILLSGKKGRYTSMALAGTRLKDPGNESWSDKDLQEQGYVSQYIEHILQTSGVEFTKYGPVNHQAGVLEHILTRYEFELKDNIWQLLDKLHPTPAVCGLPAVIARKFILAYERHDRAYYSGYLGPVNFEAAQAIYVNLRCMKATKEDLSLYLGGGIVADSNPEKEWQETVNKSKTLLNIFKHSEKLV